jgi:uncharacterized protein YeaO (DUF488 family)
VAIRVVRLGSPRLPGEGLRLGTARRPPRGVRKGDYASQNYFDVWFPDLAPSQALVSWALAEPWTDGRWARYVKRYRAEMKAPERQRLLDVLARLSLQADFSIGCYCEREDRCHRSILREMLASHGARLASSR